MIRLGIIGLARGAYLIHNRVVFGCDYQVVAVCDTDSRLLDKYDSLGSRRFLNYEEMILSVELDAIYVACPPPIQLEVAIFGLANSINVISEVSIVEGVADFLRLEAAVSHSSALFYLCENYSYTPVNWSLRELVSRGFFGRITRMSSGYIHDCANLTFDGNKLSWRGELRKNCSGNDYASHALIPALQILNAEPLNKLDRQSFDIWSFDGPSARLNNVKHLICDDENDQASIQGDFNISVLSSADKDSPLIIVEHDILSPRPHNVVSTTLIGELGGWLAGRIDGENGILYSTASGGESTGIDTLSTKTSIATEGLFRMADYPLRRLSELGWKLPFVLCFERIIDSINLKRDDGDLSLVAHIAKFQTFSSGSSRKRNSIRYGSLLI